MKKITTLLIALSIIISMSSCRKNKDTNTETAVETTPVEETLPSDPELDTMLIENGKSNYQIVIPAANESKYITIAAQELQDFIFEATSISLPVITDQDIDTISEDDCYLSIGETKIFAASNIEANFDTLGDDGLRLYTYLNSIVMIGGGYRGSMYAAYEFLERQFNFENYASDEYYIDHNVTNLRLKQYDVTEIPTFARRSVGLFSYSRDETFRNRMRQELYNESWITWSHSYFKILAPATYKEAHPDWFSSDGTQLCLTNEDMYNEFVKLVIQMIKDNPDCSYMSLGHEDKNTVCTCGKCSEEIDKYMVSGYQIRFVNRVATAVQEYLDEYEGGRKFYFSTFAYYKSQAAPLDENKQPLDPSVIPADNVRILIAPIYACNSHDYYSECNSDINTLFSDWNVVAEGKIYMWIYNKVFSNYFIPFNNFSTLVDNYQILEDIGATFVYHQGNKETEAGGMQELKSYVEAKLMWDNTLSPDKLAEDFINHYYKDAAPYYSEYYDLVRFSYAKWELDGLHCHNSSSKAEAIADTKYWTRDLLDQFNDLFIKMLDSIEKYKTTDEDLYEKLNLRIQKEYLTVRYLYLRFYFDEFSYDEGKVMVDEFEYYCKKWDISVWREMALKTSTEMLITSFVASLREELNQK